MGLKFLPYEIEVVSSSSPLSEGIFGLRQHGNEIYIQTHTYMLLPRYKFFYQDFLDSGRIKIILKGHTL